MNIYKLVGVGGSIRGEEYTLDEGENIFGRASQNDHSIGLNGISSKHFKIIIKEDFISIEDLDSSNGTFVNDKLISSKSIFEGDVIAVPNAIFKLTKTRVDYVEKASKVDKFEDAGEKKTFLTTKIVPLLSKVNESYEWKYILYGCLVLLSFFCSVYSIDSLLSKANQYVLKEAGSKAEILTDEVVRTNARRILNRELDKINLSYLDNINEVVSYFLTDTKGVILAPGSMMNKYVENTFTLSAIESLKLGSEGKVIKKKLGGATIGVAKAIYANNLESQSRDTVGYIAIILRPATLRNLEVNNKVYYLEVLIITILSSLIFGLILYLLTKNYLETLTRETKEIFDGNKKSYESQLQFAEGEELKTIISQMGFKLRELSQDEFSDSEIEDDDTGYLNSLVDILKGFPGAGMVLKSDKSIFALNPDGEDILGIRENLVSGEDLADVIRDQALAAKIMSLADQSADLNGSHCNQNVEINGVDFLVSLSSLIGKDNFPKGYLVSFYKES